MSISLDNLETAIAAAIDSPTRVEVDGVAVSAPSGYEKIAVAKYLASINATRDLRKAFTRIQIVPPGTA